MQTHTHTHAIRQTVTYKHQYMSMISEVNTEPCEEGDTHGAQDGTQHVSRHVTSAVHPATRTSVALGPAPRAGFKGPVNTD